MDLDKNNEGNIKRDTDEIGVTVNFQNCIWEMSGLNPEFSEEEFSLFSSETLLKRHVNT